MMRAAKRIGLLLLPAAALLLLVLAKFPREDDVFVRIDRDDPAAWQAELANVRFLEDERMSGSAQFSEAQFYALAEDLGERSGDVWIVDCRLESHGLINGVAVSWCGENNAANLGKTAEEVEAEEQALSALEGKTITAYTAENDRPVDASVFDVEKWQTERALAESAGMHYLRLACPDHCFPPAQIIDAFIGFARDLEPGAWLHFHCQAGSGRTGAFMTVYEMMQRPDASVEEILRHQAETGSGNLLDRSAPEKSHEQKERCVLIRAVYRYIQENRKDGYEVSCSEWLAEHSHTCSMQVGEKLDAAPEGFSSDQLVVSDSLEAVAPGRATVLADGEVYFITVR